MYLTQKKIESLSHEEYSHLLAYGEPYDHDFQPNESSWIPTLESTTYPDLTFGYKQIIYG